MKELTQKYEINITLVVLDNDAKFLQKKLI
jgi:hypothetical protein